MSMTGGGDRLWAVGVAWAGNGEAAGRVRRLERQVGDADTEVKRTGRVREGEAEKGRALSLERVGRGVARVERIGRPERRAGDAGAGFKQSRRARGGAEGSGDLSQEQVEEVGRLGCLSPRLTAGDFVPVPNGSEYIKEKN